MTTLQTLRPTAIQTRPTRLTRRPSEVQTYPNQPKDDALRTTDTIRPGNRHSVLPQCWFLLGRRGDGKSLSMSSVGLLLREVFERFKTGTQIWANYDFAGADRVDPYLVDTLSEDPFLAQNVLILIDEIRNSFDNRRGMGSHVIRFSTFLEQIRKLESDCIFATQQPQFVDQRITSQVNLFIRCAKFDQGRGVDWKIHDWWGEITGDDSRKPWPPRDGFEDGEVTLVGADAAWGSYDTREYFVSHYAENRDEQIDRMYQFNNPEPEAEPLNTAMSELIQPASDAAVTKGDIMTLALELSRLSTTHDIRQRLELVSAYDPTIENVEAAKKVFEAMGYAIQLRGRTWLAVKE